MTTPHTTPGSFTAQSEPERDNRLVRFVRRHPLLTLMLVFNTFGQALVFVPLLMERTSDTHLNLEVFQSISTILFLLVPALVITRFVRGAEAFGRLLRDGTRFRVPPRWYLIPLLLVPAGGVLFALSFREDSSAIDLLAAYVTGFLPSLAIQFLSTNWWEELVWMGVVQVPLQRRYGALRGALLTTPLFALQHVVLFADMPLAEGLTQLIVLSIAIVFVRSFLAWQYNRTRSLALTGLTHAAANAAAAGFAAVLVQPVQGALVLALSGLVLVIATKGQLGTARHRPPTQGG